MTATTESVGGRSLVDEPSDLVLQVRVVLEDSEDLFAIIDLLEERRIIASDAHDCPLDLPLVGLQRLHGLGLECLLTPHAELLVPWRLLVAAGAGDRPDRLGLLVGDVLTVDPRELVIGLVAEDRDVPSGDAAATRPPVVFLDVGLVHALAREVAGRALPEVRQRDRPVDARTFGGALEGLREHLVGEVVDLVELAPEVGVAVVATGVVLKPALEVGDTRDERDRSLAGLPVDGDAETVLVVGDVTDAEISELATPNARVPGDGDHRGVAVVVRRLDHRHDVFVPVEHVARVGLGVVAATGLARDPLETGRWVRSFGQVLAEDAECDPVVSVRLLVVVLAVDPADEVLGSVAVLEGASEVADFLSHPRAVTEELLMTMLGIITRPEEQFVTEIEECVDVLLDESVAFRDALIAKRVDAVRRVRHSLANARSLYSSYAGIRTSGTRPSTGSIPQVQSLRSRFLETADTELQPSPALKGGGVA